MKTALQRLAELGPKQWLVPVDPAAFLELVEHGYAQRIQADLPSGEVVQMFRLTDKGRAFYSEMLP